MNKYKSEQNTSYTLGITLTIELLMQMPEMVKCIYFHNDFEDGIGKKRIEDLCKSFDIPIIVNNKIFNVLSNKENCYCIGEFIKFHKELTNGNHIVLVNPSDAGNLGTIERSALGFGFNNIAVIKPCVDHFNPKAVRASMGALFHLNIKVYETFENYYNEFSNHSMFPFMLKAKENLGNIKSLNKEQPISLIFGNEAKGLPDEFLKIGTPIIINHSSSIDSLNLPIACSIAMYEASKK